MCSIQVYIPIEGLNWSHTFWGDDALQFKSVCTAPMPAFFFLHGPLI